MQGQTAQKIFAFDEGDVWRHPGPTSRSFIPRSSAICVRSFEIVATAHVGRHYAKQDKHNLAHERKMNEVIEARLIWRLVIVHLSKLFI